VTRGCQLLVSVKNAAEAWTAADSGADIIDAKDPTRGSLGPVEGRELRAITERVGDRRPVSAAIGELDDHAAVGAGEAAAAGVAFVKVGCPLGQTAGPLIEWLDRVNESLRRCAAPGRSCRLILAAYADGPVSSHPDTILELAVRTSAVGVLLDTMHKGGPSLFDAMDPDAVATWVAVGQAAGLIVALAGSLRLEDIAVARATGADVIGVRGVVCDGGRTGRLSAARVRAVLQEAGGELQAAGGR
jgi:uncharacterized protein (UPF0264 family)